MKRTPAEYAQDAVRELHGTVGMLAACIQQGVTRPWRPPPLTSDRRRELAEAARAERLERVGIAPGESPAPLDLEVMDTLVEILATGEQITVEVAAVLDQPAPARATSAFADPRPVLAALLQLLDLAGDDLAASVEHRARRLVDTAHEALGLVTDGQVLKALCPWCEGRTEAAPIGGAQTLRVRNVPGLAATVVTCEGGMCEPSEQDCGTWWRGRPAWQQHEWDWLAQRIEATADRRASA